MLDKVHLVEDEVAEVHQEVGCDFGRDDAADALDGDVALELASQHQVVVVAGLADDAVAIGLLGEAAEAGGEGLGGSTLLLNRNAQLVDGFLEDFTGPVEALLDHLVVGFFHQDEFGVDFALEYRIVDAGAGLDLAVETEFVEVAQVGLDVALVEELNVAAVAKAEAQSDGAAGLGGADGKSDGFHSSDSG